jgi:hypothetical protein
MDQGDLRGRVHKLLRWGLGLLRAGSFSLVYMSVGDLERICIKTPRDLPRTCSCTWCFIQNKKVEKKDSSDLRTREPYFIQTQIFLGFLFYFIFTMRLTQTRLN